MTKPAGIGEFIETAGEVNYWLLKELTAMICVDGPTILRLGLAVVCNRLCQQHLKIAVKRGGAAVMISVAKRS